MSDPAKVPASRGITALSGPVPPEELLRKMAEAAVPNLYFNGFGIAYAPADATIFLNLNERVIGKLSLSHETMRSLSKKLVEGIAQFDEASGTTLPSSDEISEALQKNLASPGKK
jgi:hypothetical protein